MKKRTKQIWFYIVCLVVAVITGFICIGIPYIVNTSDTLLLGGCLIYVTILIVINDLITQNNHKK